MKIINSLFNGIPTEDRIIVIAILIGLLAYFYYSFVNHEDDGEIIDDHHSL